MLSIFDGIFHHKKETETMDTVTTVTTQGSTPAPQAVAFHPMAAANHPVWSQLSIWLQFILAVLPTALAPVVSAKTLGIVTTETQLAGGVLAGVEQASNQPAAQ